MGNIIFGNFYGTPNKIECFDTLKCLTNKKRSFQLNINVIIIKN